MRRGFALIAVLWLIVVVGGAALASAAATREDMIASRNRVLHARGRWAAEACLNIALRRGADGVTRDSSALNLGRTTRCAWRFVSPAARLNLSMAARPMLERFLVAAGVPADTASAVVDSIHARRSGRALLSVAEVPELPARLAGLVTVDGTGRIDLLAAPREVLLTIPGMTEAAVEALLLRRTGGRALRSLQELLGDLDPRARDALLRSFADASRATVIGSDQLTLHADGWVDAPWPVPRATIEVTVVRGPGGLAVLRRRMM